ncbi:hypothetical protein F511_15742 [Dorcoceras hygrometricum]|uniref:Uncharacterized protein n=1 Tax=Dorcoceras hygrometricum TaxID=472368 RepID=A0A2Z7AXP4_9LAMI|nr:hypothetical protein F511_15742 [Dorcoceras hygrometricum]
MEDQNEDGYEEESESRIMCTRSVSIGPADTEKSQAGSDKKKNTVADQSRRELRAIEKMSKLESKGTPKLVQHRTSKLEK